MNTRTKGRAFETWCKKYLENMGYSVHLCGRIAMFVGPGKMITKGDDIFGADLVAVQEDRKVAFIQCTLDKHITKRKEEFDKYRFNLDYCFVELWQKNGKEVVLYSYRGKEAGLIESERIKIGRSKKSEQDRD
jgi:hypothetical protein